MRADPAPAAAAFPAKDSRYHDYAEMVATIQAAQAAHPDIVQVQSIGKSYQGRDIWAVKVSDNVAVDEHEPEVLFDGLHHAREHLSVEQSLAILVVADGRLRHRRGRITRIVNTREIWIVPMVNPDGGEYDIAGSDLPRLAQEPPAEQRHDRGRHRHQPQLRLPLGVLRRLVRHRSRRETYHGSRGLLDARGARRCATS